MVLQLAKATAAHAEERNSLKEKAERLQKANKQRRQELGELQDKFSAMHQRAAAYDQVRGPRCLLGKQKAPLRLCLQG